ncbi:MAG TPA: radical SAM protein [Thermoanaerobaculia bacterium]|nr:radical SAM protein [Thermoanaerobaculia bacterium]
MIETQQYGDFAVGLYSKVHELRLPLNGTIEVTNRCPLTCAHCYNNLPMNDHHARRAELTLEDHKRIVDELAELGCMWLLYTGGEIFARADFLDIYAHARSRGFIIVLFTNGTMITERIADYLVANPPFDIEITLYGATKETYDALTGIPGSYELCMRGIRLLLQRNLPLKLKTVATSINVHEIPAMQQMADELGVSFKFDPMINPRIDCSASPLEVRLTPVEVVALDLDTPSRVVEWRRLATDLSTAPPEPGNEPLYECGGGVNSFAIDPYGDLSICVLSHVDRYNVKQGSVREGWETYLRGVRDRRATRITKCTMCALKSLCGSCTANRELENGDPEKPVDFLCRTAHLRASVFDVDVPPHGDCEYCSDGSRHGELLEMVDEVHARRGADVDAIRRAPLPPPSASACGSGGCGSCSLTK